MTVANNSEKTPCKRRLFLLSADLLIPLCLLTLVSLLFNMFPWDIQLQSRVYTTGIGWHYGDAKWVKLLYNYGNIPALLVAISSLIIFILGYRKQQLIRYRKMSLYLILVLVIGPGLIVNSVFKDNWGRPRPRDIVEFGGKYQYEAPLQIDRSSPGKSFPCGHATMGFYFYAIGFILRSRHRYLSSIIMLLSSLYGSAIGLARVLQGGHFVSDVVWAGSLIFLCSYILWRVMKLHETPFTQFSESEKPQKLGKWQLVMLIIVGVLIVLGVSLATPYSSNQIIHPDLSGKKRVRVHISIADALVSISDSSAIHVKANGFGFPSSKSKMIASTSETGLLYEQKIHGFFTELHAATHVQVDTAKVETLQFLLGKGTLTIEVPESFVDTLTVSRDSKQIQNFTQIPISRSNDSNTAKYWFSAPQIRILYSSPK